MATEDRKVQIGVEVDATQAREGFAEVKQGAHDMATSVGAAGTQAGKGLDSLGSAGEKASAKLDRSTKSIVSSIQRTTAAAEAGGTATTGYYEAIARQRGISVDALRPYLDQLDIATAKQKAAATGVVDMTLSAGQLKNALRGVPAQFTDIATSLASGQAPLTVLMQQGGQLKDVFGGAGNAARAMGSYVVGLINPFTILATTVGVVGTAYYQGSKEADALAKSIILTGNAAGASVGQLQDMAKALAAATGATQGATSGALEQAVSTGKVVAANLQLVSEAAVRLERATGKAISETVSEFAELGKEPVKASEKLNDKYNYLTASVYAQIKALEEQGKTLEAGALAQQTYANAMNGRSEQIVQNLGHIEAAWKGIVGTAKNAWDAMLGVGRQAGLSDQIAEQKRIIEGIRNGSEVGNIDVAQKYLATLEATATNQAKEAAAKAESNRQEQARIAWLKEGDKYLSRAEERERAITKARNEGLAAGQSEVEIAKRVAAIREKMADPKERKAHTGKSQEQKDAEELEKILDRINGKSSGLDAGYYKDLQALFTAYKGGKLDLEAYRGAVEKLTVSQKFHTDAVAADKKAREEAQKAQDAYFENWQKYLVGLDQEAAKLEDQAATYGLGRRALAALTLARAEDTLQKARDNGVADDYLAKLEQEVELRKRIAAATASLDVEEANAKAAEKAGQEWQRVSDDIGRGLTDAIFTGGKDGWELLKKTIEATVIRAAVQPMVTQGVQGIMQSMGFGGTGGASGGGGFSLGNMGSLINTGSQLAGLSGGLSAFTGAAGYMQLGSMASSFTTGLSAAAGGADLAGAIAAYNAAGMGATATSLSAGASAAGALGSSAGMVGTALSGLAAAAPYLAVALLVADQLGAFKGPTYHHGGAWTAGTDGTSMAATAATEPNWRLTWGAYNSDRSTGYDTAAKSISEGLIKQLAVTSTSLGGLGQYKVSSRFVSDNDDWSEGAIRIVDAAGKRVVDFEKRYTANGAEAMKAFAEDVPRMLYKALQKTDLSPVANAMLRSIDPMTASLEDLTASLSQAQTVMAVLSVSTDDVLKSAAEASMTATEAWYSSGDKLRALAASASMSIDTIVSGLKERYDAEIALLANLDAVSKQTTQTVSESIRNLKFGLLDTEGQYAMLDAEAARYMDTLRTLTDPTLIAEYVGKLNGTINQAWGLIPDGIKEDTSQAFIDRFTQLETLAQTRIESARQQAIDDQKQLATVISTAIIDAFGGVAPAIQEAADSIPKTISISFLGSGARNVATTEVGY